MARIGEGDYFGGMAWLVGDELIGHCESFEAEFS